MISKIISAQSVDVDAVTGATTSSGAIKGAVSKALDKAAAAASTGFSGGAGTSEDPYVISSEAGLVWFPKQVSDGNSYADKYIKLGQDITLTGQWSPIGSQTRAFAGHFDGQGHSISGLTIGSVENRSQEVYAGLFGYVLNTATLHNIRLENVKIYTDASTTTAYGGALLAYAKVDAASGKGTLIDNCFASGVLDIKTSNNKPAMVGGLVGFTNQYSILSNSGADSEGGF